MLFEGQLPANLSPRRRFQRFHRLEHKVGLRVSEVCMLAQGTINLEFKRRGARRVEKPICSAMVSKNDQTIERMASVFPDRPNM